ncbi:Ribonuclease 2 [Apostasia shenzhenica]|uniref:Ribonuclease 2 n=1 Tax=Apostasia shenzhenica TaxID=1088818 RepID=A0A2I0B1A6_9ASPA|nr:Ribonuclease 2 [Apostasia shenzhenica]
MLQEILRNDGIFVGIDGKYAIGDIISAIEKAVGALPLLHCKRDSLEELQLCFDKDFKPRDCVLRLAVEDEDSLKSRNYCPRYINLPTYSSLAQKSSHRAGSASLSNRGGQHESHFI